MPETVTALPETVNLSLYAGDDITLELNIAGAEGEPADLDGAEIFSQIRPTPAGPLAAEFEVTVDAERPGTAYLHLTPEVSAALPSRGAWDVQISWNDGQNVTTMLAGSVTVAPEVTRPGQP